MRSTSKRSHRGYGPLPSFGGETRLPQCCFITVALIPALWSCSPDRESDPTLGERWDSAGVEIVEHRALGSYNGPRSEVSYLMEVPETLPDAAGEFATVIDADLLPDGSLAVLDEISADVRVFSPNGQLLRRIGRKGHGPGELSGQMILGVLSLSMDRIAVPDVINQAIVLFDTDGSHLENLHWNVMEETIPQWRVWSGDTVLVLVSNEDTNAFVRRTLDGAWRDTLAIQPAPSKGPETPDGRGPLFANHALWAASAQPDRLALAQMAQAAVFLYEGKTLRRIIRWTPNQAALGEGEIDTILRVVARAMGDPEGKPDTPLRYFNPPEHAPAVADLQLGPGLFMVQRLRPFSAMDQRILSTLRAAGYGGPLWDVFSWSGKYLGVIDFGEAVQVFRVRGDTVVGVQEDSLGVQRPFLALLPPEITGGGELP